MSEQNKWKQKHDSMFQKSRMQREKYETEIAKLKELMIEASGLFQHIHSCNDIEDLGHEKIAVMMRYLNEAAK